ncbi:hypothetical protein SPLC1_S201220 [Arthrospira platensis C1]|nr:hypothetical protein SPLC1_S201220 [Arthrospira platensis C1]
MVEKKCYYIITDRIKFIDKSCQYSPMEGINDYNSQLDVLLEQFKLLR